MIRSSRPLTRPSIARVLYDIAQNLESARDVDARITNALDSLGRIVTYDHCILLFARPDGKTQSLIQPSVAPDLATTLKSAAARALWLLMDEASQGQPLSASSEIARFPWPAYLAVPLIGLDQVLGVLAIGRVTNEPFEEEDLALLSVVASQLAGYRTALDEFAERSHVEYSLNMLVEAGSVLGNSLNLEDTLRDIAKLAVDYLADHCVIDLLEHNGSPAAPVIAAKDPRTAENISELRRRYPLDINRPNSPVAQALTSGEPVLVTEPATVTDPHDRDLARSILAQSTITVPLSARGRTLGAMTFASMTPGRYGTEDIALAQELAHRCALAVDNSRLYRDVQRQIASHMQLNAELNRALEARDRALADASEAGRQLQGFLSNISHDLKNPLSAIKAQVQNARRHMAQAGSAEEHWLGPALVTVARLATRMTRQLDELADLAQLQSGAGIELRRQPTDLVTLVRQVVEEHGSDSDRHQVVFVTDEPALMGDWDAARLGRVAANLIGNAITYSPDGGTVLVTLRRERDESGEWALLQVQDHGLGIPAEDLPHIFERFHRGRNVIGRIDGTGIGLASVRQIIDMHRGHITASSEEGQGSVFTVRLPL